MRDDSRLHDTFVGDAVPTPLETLPPDSPDLLPKGYVPVRVLGRGGTGMVVLAQDSALERPVAIKLVHGDEGVRQNELLDEARCLARVEHPNLVRVYSYGEHGGQPYLVMEYIEGRTLECWLRARRGKAVPLALARRIMSQLLDGVEALHRGGAAHRDIKPANVIVEPSGRVRLIDFGLAARRGEAPPERKVRAGTPDYMAPELIRRGLSTCEADAKADIYALGVMFYLLLTLRLPFEHHTEAGDILNAHLGELPRRPSRLRSELAGTLEELLAGMLLKEEDLRWDARRCSHALRPPVAASEPEQMVTGARVLCVDDDVDLCCWIKELLEAVLPEAEVRLAHDGRDALEAIDSFEPDLVVTDLAMPRLDGIELTAVLRERNGARDLPILAMSAHGGPEQWAELRAMGATRLMLKPLDADVFVDDVVRALNLRLPPSPFAATGAPLSPRT